MALTCVVDITKLQNRKTKQNPIDYNLYVVIYLIIVSI